MSTKRKALENLGLNTTIDGQRRSRALGTRFRCGKCEIAVWEESEEEHRAEVLRKIANACRLPTEEGGEAGMVGPRTIGPREIAPAKATSALKKIQTRLSHVSRTHRVTPSIQRASAQGRDSSTVAAFLSLSYPAKKPSDLYGANGCAAVGTRFKFQPIT